MAIPPNDMTLWTLLDSKPEDIDRVNPVYDIDADEQKCQLYGVFKTFFVKTDEPSDVKATIEFQSTATEPNSLLKFGSAGEFRVYSDGIDFFLKGTNAAGKLRFYANSSEMFTINPINGSIAIYGNSLNYNGAAGDGISFDNGNKIFVNNQLNLNAHVKTTTYNISYTGLINTGLEFDASNNGIFKQGLKSTGLFEIESKMKTNGVWISYLGTLNKGLRINNDHSVECSDGLSCGGVFSSIGNITTDGNVEPQGGVIAAGEIRTNTRFDVSGNNGITYTGPISTLTIVGGIIVAYT